MKRLLLLFACLMLFIAPAFAASPDDVPRITPGELKSKMEKKEQVVILDVRTGSSYFNSKVKIKGAVRMHIGELGKRAHELPMEAEIVTYCT
ncbi:MAG: hypothetical protein HY886_10595 [Deltaproteobacteria bacterium]|nr:hypothetical protein [Deltaproteobacteria bacterium]